MFHFKADEIQQLIKRNVDFMSANSIEGTVSVSQAAVFVSNVRDRVISGMKSNLKGCKQCDSYSKYSQAKRRRIFGR